MKIIVVDKEDELFECESAAPPKDMFEHSMVHDNVNSIKLRSIFIFFF